MAHFKRAEDVLWNTVSQRLARFVLNDFAEAGAFQTAGLRHERKIISKFLTRRFPVRILFGRFSGFVVQIRRFHVLLSLPFRAVVFVLCGPFRATLPDWRSGLVLGECFALSTRLGQAEELREEFAFGLSSVYNERGFANPQLSGEGL